jgi:choline kinase
MKAVLLAAGVGQRLAPLTDERPKCLLDVAGRTILERHLAAFDALGLHDVVVVTGHLRPLIERALESAPPALRVRTIENERYREGSILSFASGIDGVDEDVIVMDADVVYDTRVLGCLVPGSGSRALVDPRGEETGEEMMIGARGERCFAIARRVSDRGPFDVIGESVGFFRIAREHLAPLRACIEATIAELGPRAEYEAALDRWLVEVPVAYALVSDLPWTEVDFEGDLDHARKRVAPLVDGGGRAGLGTT